MRVDVEFDMLLTPEKAKELLESNYTEQRTINWGWVNTMANDIAEGRWNDEMRAHDPFVLSEEGHELMNGQHRCHAVLRANNSILVRVKYADEDSFKYLDGGRPRKPNDFVDLPNTNIVTPMAKYAVSLLNGGSLGNALVGVIRQDVINGRKANLYPSRQQIVDFCMENEEVCKWCSKNALKMYNAMKVGSKSMYANAFLTLVIVEGEKAKDRVESMLEDFTRLSPESSAVAFYKNHGKDQAYDAAKKGFRIPSRFWFHLTLSAYIGFKHGKRGSKKTIDKSLDYWNDQIDKARDEQGGLSLK